MKWLCLALVLLGCQPAGEPNEGIAVGNPGLTSLSLAVTDSVALASVSGSLYRVRFAGADCGGLDVSSPVSLDIDLAQEPAAFDFPGGTWCGLILDFSGPLQFEGSWNDGLGSGALDVALTVGSVSLGAVAESMEVDEESELAFELASPGWLDLALDGLQDGETVTVDAESPLHDLLVAALSDDSQLFDDLDGDGVVAPTERDEGPLATSRELRFENADAYATTSEGVGMVAACGVAGGGSGGWALLALLGLRRRRRIGDRGPSSAA